MTNSLIDHVSFCGNYVKEHSPVSPAGLDVAGDIEVELEKRNVCIIFKGSTGYSHFFLVRCCHLVFRVDVGYVSDENADWLMFFRPNNVFFRVLRVALSRQYREFSIVLNECLVSTKKISKVRWYAGVNNWNYHPDRFFLMDRDGVLRTGT